MGGEAFESLKPKSSYPKLAERPKGQLISNIYRDRIGQFTAGGQYQSKNLLAALEEAVATGHPHVKLTHWLAPDLSRPTFESATSHDFEDTKVGDWFGPSWSTHWFKVHLTIPSELRKKELLEFHWDAGSEGMVWTHHGNPLQGLTGNGERVEWIIPDSFRDGKEHIIYIEVACNGMFGNANGDTIQPPNPNKYYQFTKANIVAVNVQARALRVDIWVIGDAARELPQDSWEQHKALMVANRIIDTFELGNQDSIIKGRKIAQEYLGKNVDSAMVYNTDDEMVIYGIGQCHIDTCWLWPWAETKRKVARSWSNQCDLMDRYPEHRFACSQAQQYKWLKQYYPYVFDRVKEKVKNGQFQPIGGSWVEHDTNLPSGESLIRQFLYGQRFFESNFGERCRTFWLPDTFGYSSQLPQICRLAGMSRFFTQKLSWNNINNFPHTTFNWVALDGSQVLCHMTPAETYTAEANFGDLRRSITQHKSMDQDKTSLFVFGKGDGGGGPTREHLEKLRRCRGVADTTGPLARVHMGYSADDFFDQLQLKASKGLEFVTWYGELYFELHRGTYTTQANNKRNNRNAEILMHNLELLATIASVTNKTYKYPKMDFDDMWESILLCQFHDCLPGSSIEMCYDDSDELYAKVFKTGKEIMSELSDALGFKDLSCRYADGWAMALNTSPWPRNEIVEDHMGRPFKVCGDGLIIDAKDAIKAFDCRVSVAEVTRGVFILENDHLRVQVEEGCVSSLYDRLADREIIPKGCKANQLVIFDDKPLYWQAWDVEVYHLDSRKVLPSSTTRIILAESHKVSVMTETKISEHSWAKTTLSLSAAVDGEPSMVEMHSEIEWRESMKFLKVEFPVDIRNTDATYETQFGLVRRPTHYNTTWDMAKFEVCCHKFADLSENGYGVTIMNSQSYGFATCGNVMRLSLLRAPKAPDAHADMGRHSLRWAILPHVGGLSSTSVRAAYNFNNPLKLIGALKEFQSPVKLNGDQALVLDTIKRGEDDEDVSRGDLPKRQGKSIIVRVYESLGGRARGRIESSLDVKRVWKTNVLEDDEEELKVEKAGVIITLRPFEVATYRLQLQEACADAGTMGGGYMTV